MAKIFMKTYIAKTNCSVNDTGFDSYDSKILISSKNIDIVRNVIKDFKIAFPMSVIEWYIEAEDRNGKIERFK
jgi:hypothetical protein